MGRGSFVQSEHSCNNRATQCLIESAATRGLQRIPRLSSPRAFESSSEATVHRRPCCLAADDRKGEHTDKQVGQVANVSIRYCSVLTSRVRATYGVSDLHH